MATNSSELFDKKDTSSLSSETSTVYTEETVSESSEKTDSSSRNETDCSTKSLLGKCLPLEDDVSFKNVLEDREMEPGCCADSECRRIPNPVEVLKACSNGQRISVGVERRKSSFCGKTSTMVCGVLLVLASLISFIFTPQDFMIWEKLNMRPGLPPYEWWSTPPDEVLLRVYLFNVTNGDRFLSGEDTKLNLQEIGPIIYREILRHTNVVHNSNDTLSYTAERKAVFLPERNTHIDMNATLVLPNFAVLGLASYMHDAGYFVKMAFRLLVQNKGSQLMVNSTIHNYLWDFGDPVLNAAQAMVPGLVPVNNMGILHRIYSDFKDNITVYIGPRWGNEMFFTMDMFNGEPALPGYAGSSCPDKVQNATEGVMYTQRMTRRTKVLYWRKTLCKLMPLYFDGEIISRDIPVYRYNLSENAFDRISNATDCYQGYPLLKNGLSDVSKCYYNFPMAASYPHFYRGDPTLQQSVTGLTPHENKHNSYVEIEPLTGTPMQSFARSQSNLIVNNLAGFGGDYDKFSDLALPMFWAEYNQEGLPDYVYNLLYLTVIILPPLQAVMSSLALIVGCYLIAKIFYDTMENKSLATMLPNLRRNDKLDNIARNTILNYEKESFLRKCS